MTGLPDSTSKKRDRREQILHAAISMFSMQGIQATSLRQINEKSGTKNSGAVHYYFKNKYGLIEAAITYIYKNLVTEYTDDSLIAAGYPGVCETRGVRRIVYEHFLPIIIAHDTKDWGKPAIRFLAHLMMEADPKIQAIWHRISDPKTIESVAKLHQRLPLIPSKLLRRRFLFASVNVIHGLADYQSLPGTSFQVVDRKDEVQMTMDMIDYVVAGLKVKVS